MPASRVTQNSPWHVVLVLDDSGSMSELGKAAMLNEAMDGMIEEMRLQSQGTKAYFKLSIIIFGSNAHTLAEAQSEKVIDKDKITRFSGNSGSTNMKAALNEAIELLKRNQGVATDFDPYVFLLTDGHPDSIDDTVAAARALQAMKINAGQPRLISIGLGDDVNMQFLQSVASTPELAKHLKSAADLVRFFPAIGTIVSSVGGTQAIDNAIIDL